MNKKAKLIIFIELQIIILLISFLVFKVKSLEDKVYNTNKFIHKVLIDKKEEALRTINENDIIIGDSSAPVTIFMYSRFDCSACSDFFSESYEKLKKNYIDKGLVKLVVRYLVHQSKPHTLFATKCAHFAKKTGFFDSYSLDVKDMYAALDTIKIKDLIINLTKKPDSIDSFLKDKEFEASLLNFADKIRAAGIRSTPTFFINETRVIGTRPFKNFEKIIISELNK